MLFYSMFNSMTTCILLKRPQKHYFVTFDESLLLLRANKKYFPQVCVSTIIYYYIFVLNEQPLILPTPI